MTTVEQLQTMNRDQVRAISALQQAMAEVERANLNLQAVSAVFDTAIHDAFGTGLPSALIGAEVGLSSRRVREIRQHVEAQRA